MSINSILSLFENSIIFYLYLKNELTIENEWAGKKQRPKYLNNKFRTKTIIIKWDKSNDLSISIKDSLNLKVACLYVEIYLKKKKNIYGML